MNEQEKKRRMQEQRRKRRRKQVFLTWTIFLLTIVLIALLIALVIIKTDKKIKKTVWLEAGNPVSIELFLEKEGTHATFATNIDEIDTAHVGTYEVIIVADNKQYHSDLIIKDTVAPTGKAIPLRTNVGILPDASVCVTNIKDCTDVTVIYERIPNVSDTGEAAGVVLLSDEGGNKTYINIVITVFSDIDPPVIEGARDIEAYVGDSISYKANITVTDDQDENPVLEIDNSQVNLNEAGKYPVMYTATDSAGNSSTETVYLILTEKPEGYVEPEIVYDLARNILSGITNDSMTDMQKAFAIYRWVNTNIGYTGTSDKSSWTIGAYQAFTNRVGDCFNYYAAAKALLDEAGIMNVDVVKSDTSHSSHFWSLINLGDGWYHLDCTPRKGTGDNFFMVTDEELEAYSSTHNNSHVFNHELYPARATVSLQDKVDYDNGVLRE